MFSTTQIVVLSLFDDAQMLQVSVSDILWQTLQNFTLCLRLVNACVNLSTSALSCLSIYRTMRKAERRPIPGSFENSSTADSSNFEGYV